MKAKLTAILIMGAFLFACSSGGNQSGQEAHDHNDGSHNHESHGSQENPISLIDDGGSGGASPSGGHPDTSAIQKIKRSVFVPDEVKGKWKGVKLLIKDKKGGKSETKTVSLGEEFDIEGSNIHVAVKEFMPHLSIGESSFTSLSNEPVNPAVHLVVTENGKELYDGWAYAQFPDMYNFRHEKYSVTLVDYIPAG